MPATLIVNGDSPFTMADLGVISLAFGTIVVATVYALGHVSGNHINPAVTIGLAVTGKFPWSQVPAYIGAQLAGAVIGALAIIGVLGEGSATSDSASLPTGQMSAPGKRSSRSSWARSSSCSPSSV